ncbi:MAG TPA: multicopper oxidase domain-containing protein [Fibrobacteria bacterium]|nr:multicopper oxidase domain-containing protein [Fibrobacteria bacterium]
MAFDTRAFTPVVTPNGSTLGYTMEQGVKIFRLSVDVIKHEMAPGMVINAWGYNGQTPGPTIEAVEGDRVRIWVKNDLPEPTAVHWHGILLPNGMDGVQGLTQRGIQPGETFRYEFTLKQHGTFMYHSHGDEMVQMGLGTMGFLIVHPKAEARKIDRDYAIFVNEWFVPPGASTPNPGIMTDFNLFTFNSRVFPGTAPLLARPGERVRIRLGNVGQEEHPIHIHGHRFKVVATDGGDIPPSAQWSETTVLVAPGQTRTFEFTATEGDWPLHCHKRHHPMNAMGHQFPNLLGVDQGKVEDKIRDKVPGYMAMGRTGMDEMAGMGMEGPANTLPMMAGDGPFGPIGMGGMFTVVKVHADAPRFATAAEYNAKVKGPADFGWYKHPAGTVADTAGAAAARPDSAPSRIKPEGSHDRSRTQALGYACPMHPEARSDKPGNCPKCGMKLVPVTEEKK